MTVQIFPYLVLDGNGQEAVRYYEHALGAEVLGIQTFGDMPENPDYPTPPEAKDRVLNAHLKVGDAHLMLSDTFPGTPYQIGSQVTVAINFTNEEKAREVFGRLEDGGQVRMPLQATFWSPAYGQLTDKFGITWQISTEQPEK